MTSHAFFCPLAHEGVLSVRGPDAGKFLQGQLTCNLDYLSDSHSSLGARCTPKGRMLSSFRILRQADGYLLAMSADLIQAQLADLQKYAVFSKVQLADVSAEWQRVGISGLPASQFDPSLAAADTADGVARSEDLLAIGLGPARFELWLPQARAEQQLQALQQRLSQGSLNDWLLGQIGLGIGQVTAATRELFIPQMINLQAVGGVSFRKGCYTGQEIVARMQYLGKLKRRMYRLALDEPQPPLPGTELFSPVHASSVGEVVLAARQAQGCELLAVLQEDAVADGRLSLGDIQGPRLRVLELPYTLDRDREIQR
jgi:folate-binding protein YgfZ